MSKKENEKWPEIVERNLSRKRSDGVKEFTIKDARNTWEVEVVKRKNNILFKIDGFNNFMFSINEEKIVSCTKENKIRVSDSGILSSHEGRFNLIDNSGIRKTIRISNLSKYIINLFN